MEHPITTKAKPLNIRKSECFDCGAFYNLYRVIGDCTNGVPATDKIFPREEREKLAYGISDNSRTNGAREAGNDQYCTNDSRGG